MTGRPPLPGLFAVIDLLADALGEPEPLPPKRALDWLVWENVGYLVDDERRGEAYRLLAKSVGIDAKKLRDAPAAKLLAATRLGGIHPDLRAERLREIGTRVIEECGGDLDAALDAAMERSPTKALATLKKFPSIGTPGAEKILVRTGRAPLLALDSNGLRALTRLGFGTPDQSYDKAYRSVRAAVAPEIEGRSAAELARASELLRRHGQTCCKANDPRCLECPVQGLCAFFDDGVGRRGRARPS